MRAITPARRWLIFVSMCLIAAGCMSRTVVLSETPDHWRSIVCTAGPHVSRTVHGDAASADHPVWVDRAGARFETRWPAGFVARFAPELEVVAPGGKVVVREGQDLDDVSAAGYVVTCPSDGTYGVL